MAVTLEVRRHVDNDGDVLSEAGVAAAVALGRHLADVDFALAVSSGAQRATQTVASILAGAGRRVPGGVVVDAGLRSDDEDRWRAAYAKAGSGHLDALRTADPDFVAAEVEVLGAALRRIAAGLPDGARALVVGHSPTNEAAVLGLTGTTIHPLGKGEGVVLVGDASHGDVGDGDWQVAAASMPA